MRRLVSLVLALALALCLCACVSKSDYDSIKAGNKSLQQKYSELQDKYDSLEKAYDLLIESKRYMPNNTAYSPYGSVLSDSGLTIPIGATKDDIIDAIGKPDMVDGKWNFWADEDGNYVLCIVFDDAGQSNSISILEDATHYYVYGFGIGSTVSDLKSSWGAPDKQENGLCYYALDANGFQTDNVLYAMYIVEISFENGKANMISFMTKDNYVWANESNE